MLNCQSILINLIVMTTLKHYRTAGDLSHVDSGEIWVCAAVLKRNAALIALCSAVLRDPAALQHQ